MAMQPIKSALFALGACGLLSLGGCSGYDVELNGGVFDMLGVSGKQQSRAREPKVVARQGLVVPPSTASLPEPGSAQPQVAAAGGQNWPVDPDRAKALQKDARQAQHDAFCAEARRRHDAGIDQVLANGPLGSCHESIVKAFTGKPLWERKADK